MRDTFKNHIGKRMTFRATFLKWGSKQSKWETDTILLEDITSPGDTEIYEDHLWFTAGKRFRDINPEHGDRIEFVARVDTYMKGRWGSKVMDYRLVFPSKIRKM
jgi:hypothetical protein